VSGAVNAIVEVENLSKSYRQRGSKALVSAARDISFSVQQGEILGLLGPNGAGKTTTIKMICSLLRPDAGRVRVCGVDNQRARLRALRHLSAVLEGNRNLYWRLSVRENMLYFAGNRGVSARAARPRAEALLERFGLGDKADELVNNLSRGTQQKLAIAVALLADTEVVLLDEPTLGLDVGTGLEVRALLREIAAEGRTVIISTHDMAVVQELCARTVIISAGRVVADERVSSLLQLFETRSYRVTLGAPLSAEQQRRLAQRFAVFDYQDAERTLDVTFEHPEDIYDLMAILRLARTPVEDLGRTQVDFEQVFLALVKGSAADD
jgi:ABC-2 type transport system ATP-binding protein